MSGYQRKIAKVIRDPIHEYISIYEDEVPLLDSPLFQRLRHVKQNGMASLTYPALLVSRFEHSLGTMHLADRMLSSALTKGEPSIVKEFHEACAQQFKWHLSEVDSRLSRVIRAAGLLHDLGHLPFSHTTEEIVHDFAEDLLPDSVLSDWVNSRAAPHPDSLHEFLTQLFINYDPSISRGLGEDKKIVISILKQPSNEASVISTLHDILSCDIDADRSDYLLRDGHASGAEFGHFDLYRLVDGMMLTKIVLAKPKPTEHFVIRPTIRALSAIESLVLERYKAYRWLYYHHHVAISNRILEEVIWRLLKAHLDKNTNPLKNIPLSFPYSKPIDREAVIRDMADDIDIVVALRQTRKLTHDLLRQEKNNSSSDDVNTHTIRDISEMDALLDEILSRKKRGTELWKDISGYMSFNDNVKTEIERVYEKSQQKSYYQLNGRTIPQHDLKSTTKDTDFALNWVADTQLTIFSKRKDLEELVNKNLKEIG
ncbi:MAG: HD domain-containing protein, partial [Dehalococcoidales bacterium]|nr:HD domain-containing protein [Dehalococcoidales bacterium]